MKQIHELMKEISSPELEEAMKELQRQMGKLTPEQMKNAMNNFQFSQEEFNKTGTNIESSEKYSTGAKIAKSFATGRRAGETAKTT